MKNLFIILLFLLSINLVAGELQWVNEQIQAIKPPRNAISKAKINAVKDPFIFLNKKAKKTDPKIVTVKQMKTANNRNTKRNTLSTTSVNKVSQITRSFSLDAIINKSALINGRWYKVNSKVGKYTLSSVNTSSVILSYKKKELLLSTRSKTKKLKFRNN
jgi:hypothetical protein